MSEVTPLQPHAPSYACECEEVLTTYLNVLDIFSKMIFHPQDKKKESGANLTTTQKTKEGERNNVNNGRKTPKFSGHAASNTSSFAIVVGPKPHPVLLWASMYNHVGSRDDCFRALHQRVVDESLQKRFGHHASAPMNRAKLLSVMNDKKESSEEPESEKLALFYAKLKLLAALEEKYGPQDDQNGEEEEGTYSDQQRKNKKEKGGPHSSNVASPRWGGVGNCLVFSAVDTIAEAQDHKATSSEFAVSTYTEFLSGFEGLALQAAKSGLRKSERNLRQFYCDRRRHQTLKRKEFSFRSEGEWGKERARRMLQLYAPYAMGKLDELFAVYEGKELQLLEALGTKYGPEPLPDCLQLCQPRKGTLSCLTVDEEFDHKNAEKKEAEEQEERDQKKACPKQGGGVFSIKKKISANTKQRIIRFLRHYNMSHELANISQLLEAYQGREEILLKALVLRYGPEPPNPNLQNETGKNEEETEESTDTAGNEEIFSSMYGGNASTAKTTTTVKTTTSSSSPKSDPGSKSPSPVNTGGIQVPDPQTVLHCEKLLYGPSVDRIYFLLQCHDPMQIEHVHALLEKEKERVQAAWEQHLTPYPETYGEAFDQGLYLYEKQQKQTSNKCLPMKDSELTEIVAKKLLQALERKFGPVVHLISSRIEEIKNRPEEEEEGKKVIVANSPSGGEASPYRWPPPITYKQRVEKILETYVPPLRSTSKDLLKAYKGREEDLIAALVTKFGPEPRVRTPTPTFEKLPDSELQFFEDEYRTGVLEGGKKGPRGKHPLKTTAAKHFQSLMLEGGAAEGGEKGEQQSAGGFLKLVTPTGQHQFFSASTAGSSSARGDATRSGLDTEMNVQHLAGYIPERPTTAQFRQQIFQIYQQYKEDLAIEKRMQKRKKMVGGGTNSPNKQPDDEDDDDDDDDSDDLMDDRVLIQLFEQYEGEEEELLEAFQKKFNQGLSRAAAAAPIIAVPPPTPEDIHFRFRDRKSGHDDEEVDETESTDEPEEGEEAENQEEGNNDHDEWSIPRQEEVTSAQQKIVKNRISKINRRVLKLHESSLLSFEEWKSQTAAASGSTSKKPWIHTRQLKSVFKLFENLQLSDDHPNHQEDKKAKVCTSFYSLVAGGIFVHVWFSKLACKQYLQYFGKGEALWQKKWRRSGVIPPTSVVELDGKLVTVQAIIPCSLPEEISSIVDAGQSFHQEKNAIASPHQQLHSKIKIHERNSAVGLSQRPSVDKCLPISIEILTHPTNPHKQMISRTPKIYALQNLTSCCYHLVGCPYLGERKKSVGRNLLEAGDKQSNREDGEDEDDPNIESTHEKLYRTSQSLVEMVLGKIRSERDEALERKNEVQDYSTGSLLSSRIVGRLRNLANRQSPSKSPSRGAVDTTAEASVETEEVLLERNSLQERWGFRFREDATIEEKEEDEKETQSPTTSSKRQKRLVIIGTVPNSPAERGFEVQSGSILLSVNGYSPIESEEQLEEITQDTTQITFVFQQPTVDREKRKNTQLKKEEEGHLDDEKQFKSEKEGGYHHPYETTYASTIKPSLSQISTPTQMTDALRAALSTCHWTSSEPIWLALAEFLSSPHIWEPGMLPTFDDELIACLCMILYVGGTSGKRIERLNAGGQQSVATLPFSSFIIHTNHRQRLLQFLFAVTRFGHVERTEIFVGILWNCVLQFTSILLHNYEIARLNPEQVLLNPRLAGVSAMLQTEAVKHVISDFIEMLLKLLIREDRFATSSRVMVAHCFWILAQFLAPPKEKKGGEEGSGQKKKNEKEREYLHKTAQKLLKDFLEDQSSLYRSHQPADSVQSFHPLLFDFGFVNPHRFLFVSNLRNVLKSAKYLSAVVSVFGAAAGGNEMGDDEGKATVSSSETEKTKSQQDEGIEKQQIHLLRSTAITMSIVDQAARLNQAELSLLVQHAHFRFLKYNLFNIVIYPEVQDRIQSVYQQEIYAKERFDLDFSSGYDYGLLLLEENIERFLHIEEPLMRYSVVNDLESFEFNNLKTKSVAGEIVILEFDQEAQARVELEGCVEVMARKELYALMFVEMRMVFLREGWTKYAHTTFEPVPEDFSLALSKTLLEAAKREEEEATQETKEKQPTTTFHRRLMGNMIRKNKKRKSAQHPQDPTLLFLMEHRSSSLALCFCQTRGQAFFEAQRAYKGEILESFGRGCIWHEYCQVLKETILQTEESNLRYWIEQEQYMEFTTRIALEESTSYTHSSSYCLQHLERHERSMLEASLWSSLKSEIPDLEMLDRFYYADVWFGQHEEGLWSISFDQLTDEETVQRHLIFRDALTWLEKQEAIEMRSVIEAYVIIHEQQKVFLNEVLFPFVEENEVAYRRDIAQQEFLERTEDLWIGKFRNQMLAPYLSSQYLQVLAFEVCPALYIEGVFLPRIELEENFVRTVVIVNQEAEEARSLFLYLAELHFQATEVWSDVRWQHLKRAATIDYYESVTKDPDEDEDAKEERDAADDEAFAEDGSGRRSRVFIGDQFGPMAMEFSSHADAKKQKATKRGEPHRPNKPSGFFASQMQLVFESEWEIVQAESVNRSHLNLQEVNSFSRIMAAKAHITTQDYRKQLKHLMNEADEDLQDTEQEIEMSKKAEHVAKSTSSRKEGGGGATWLSTGTEGIEGEEHKSFHADSPDGGAVKQKRDAMLAYKPKTLQKHKVSEAKSSPDNKQEGSPHAHEKKQQVSPVGGKTDDEDIIGEVKFFRRKLPAGSFHILMEKEKQLRAQYESEWLWKCINIRTTMKNEKQQLFLKQKFGKEKDDRFVTRLSTGETIQTRQQKRKTVDAANNNKKELRTSRRKDAAGVLDVELIGGGTEENLSYYQQGHMTLQEQENASVQKFMEDKEQDHRVLILKEWERILLIILDVASAFGDGEINFEQVEESLKVYAVVHVIPNPISSQEIQQYMKFVKAQAALSQAPAGVSSSSSVSRIKHGIMMGGKHHSLFQINHELEICQAKETADRQKIDRDWLLEVTTQHSFVKTQAEKEEKRRYQEKFQRASGKGGAKSASSLSALQHRGESMPLHGGAILSPSGQLQFRKKQPHFLQPLSIEELLRRPVPKEAFVKKDELLNLAKKELKEGERPVTPERLELPYLAPLREEEERSRKEIQAHFMQSVVHVASLVKSRTKLQEYFEVKEREKKSGVGRISPTKTLRGGPASASSQTPEPAGSKNKKGGSQEAHVVGRTPSPVKAHRHPTEVLVDVSVHQQLMEQLQNSVYKAQAHGHVESKNVVFGGLTTKKTTTSNSLTTGAATTEKKSRSTVQMLALQKLSTEEQDGRSIITNAFWKKLQQFLWKENQERKSTTILEIENKKKRKKKAADEESEQRKRKEEREEQQEETQNRKEKQKGRKSAFEGRQGTTAEDEEEEEEYAGSPGSLSPIFASPVAKFGSPKTKQQTAEQQFATLEAIEEREEHVRLKIHQQEDIKRSELKIKENVWKGGKMRSTQELQGFAFTRKVIKYEMRHRDPKYYSQTRSSILLKKDQALKKKKQGEGGEAQMLSSEDDDEGSQKKSPPRRDRSPVKK